MKKISLLFLALILISCSNNLTKEDDAKILSQLTELANEHNYFKLKAEFQKSKEQLSNTQQLYFEAIINTAFFNPKKSNQAIDELIAATTNDLADSLMLRLYSKKVYNHMNLFEYKKAAEAITFTLDTYGSIMDSLSIDSFRNIYKMDFALANTPKQEVIRNKSFTIPLVRDIANVLNIDVTSNSITKNFIYDTGANISVIRKSFAEKMDMQIIKCDFLVGTATSKMVKSDLAIAHRLDIGGLTYKNVVFLVFEDADMSISGYDFYGVIGFPVIKAMEEIHISKDNNLFIPKEISNYTNQNFAINGLMPLVSVIHKKDSLIFDFDTGAKNTALYPKFYKKYQQEITYNYQKKTLTHGSAGGNESFDGYLISDVNLKIGNSETTLNKLKLHIDKIDNTESSFHGNLGQDYIKSFDKMIISFNHAFIEFQ